MNSIDALIQQKGETLELKILADILFFEPLLGTDISKAARMAIDLAGNTHHKVFLRFNGVHIPIGRKMDTHDVFIMYHMLLGKG